MSGTEDGIMIGGTMETQISGMMIRTVQKQMIRNTDVLNIPIRTKANEKIRGEIWLRLYRESEFPKLRRFLNRASRYSFTQNTRYLRTVIPCDVICYFEDSGKCLKAQRRYTPGIIFTLLETFAPGTVALKWIRERSIDLSNPQEVEKMFDAMNKRKQRGIYEKNQYE